MSKFLCLGMPLEKLIAAVTATPANIMRKTAIGSIKIDTAADITILNIEQRKFNYTDGEQQVMQGDKRFVVKSLIKDGVIL
jgi:dihydroorotase